MSNRQMELCADILDLVLELTMTVVVIVAGIKYIFWG